MSASQTTHHIGQLLVQTPSGAPIQPIAARSS
jgi:hypothetical protein